MVEMQRGLVSYIVVRALIHIPGGFSKHCFGYPFLFEPVLLYIEEIRFMRPESEQARRSLVLAMH